MTTSIHITRKMFSIPRLGFLDTLAFTIPLVQFLQINIVGRLYLTELLLAAVLLWLSFNGKAHRLLRRTPFLIIGLLLIWLAAQAGTDIIHSTPFRDYARGWAKISFTLINFCALYLLLYGNEKRLVLFAAGAATGDLLIYFVAPHYHAAAHPWKFGYGLGLTWLLVLISAFYSKKQNSIGRLLPTAILIGTSALNFYMGFRSLGGVLFLAAAYIAYPVALGKKYTFASRKQLRKLLPLGIGLAFSAAGVWQSYEYAVKNGWLGDEANQKYEQQTSGGYGLLLGGRTEYIVSTKAIFDAPLIGHGSWAKDCYYTSLLRDIKAELGYHGWTPKEDCLIPSHSYLMGAWVESGIIGAVFWLVILGFTVRVLIHLNIADTRLAPLVAFVAFLLVWNVLFSPFAAHARFMVPFAIVMFMSYLPTYYRLKPAPPSGGQ